MNITGPFKIVEWMRRLSTLLRRGKFDRELAEEMRLHRELRERELRARGMDADEASRLSRKQFGNESLWQDRSRTAWGWTGLETLLRDCLYASRSLLKAPTYAATAALTLVLGIGASTAIFSVVNTVLLRPLHYADSSRLLRLEEKHQGWESVAFSYATYLDLARAPLPSIPSVAGYRPFSFNVTGGGEPEQVDGAFISANLFSTLGVYPELGRPFTADEQREGANHVVILSYGLWQGRFGGAPDVLGKTLRVSDAPYEIVGVMPAGFQFPDQTSWLPGSGTMGLWIPMPFDGELTANRRSHLIKSIGRLAPGATLAEARAELDSLARQINQRFPGVDEGMGIGAWNLKQRMTAHVQPALLVLLGAVALMVLAACANVANLVLIRNTSRSREFAVRAALGASRGRLLRQSLVESALLGLAGGAGGVLLAVWSVRLIAALGLQDVPRLSEVRVDGYVLAFAFGLSLSTALLFGAVPALQSCWTDPNDSLKQGAKGSTSSKGTRLRAALVVAEVSLALMLLVGAGLLINSFVRLSQVSPGFDEKNLLTMSLFLSPARYDSRGPEIASFLETVAGRARSVPGVVSATVVNSLPVKGGVNTDFEIVGRPKGKQDLDADVRIADENYLETMRIPLLRGRWFNRFDTARNKKVIVISAAMARKYWPDENPVGAQVTMLDWGPPLTGEIVGVVGDIRDALDQPASSFFYWPERQFPSIFASLVVRTAGEPSRSAQAVKEAVWSVDPAQSVASVQTMEEILAGSVARRRMQTALVGAFAALALLLAVVGIYGVLAYSVSERTREMGIRMALGANAVSVRNLVLREGSALTSIGLAIGLAGAIALAGVLSTQLYGIAPRDPATLAGITLLLAVVSMAACYLPARRATRVDPVVALRHE